MSRGIRLEDLPPEHRERIRRERREAKRQPLTPAQKALRKAERKAKKEKEYLEREKFVRHCESNDLPTPTPEHRFHKTRKWRFDWSWPETKVALEIEGGIWNRGRHTRGAGYKADMEKYSEASILGWTVVRIEPKQLYEATTLAMIRRAIGT